MEKRDGIHRVQGVTEGFEEYENDKNHMLWTWQPPDFILHQGGRQHSPPSSLQHNMRENVFKNSIRPSSSVPETDQCQGALVRFW